MGCAGLSLAVRMIRSGKLAGKKMLLVDREEKNSNDRTWCFWEKEPGLFEEIVYKKWSRLIFRNDGFEKTMDISPWEYKMIRGIDFYSFARQIIEDEPGVETAFGHVSEFVNHEQSAGIILDGQTIMANYVFNSIQLQKPVLKEKEHFLLQHFKGWIIRTNRPFFDSSAATLMDFNTSQEHGTAFVYVMPLSENRALVEYTLFTPSLLREEEYHKGLQSYIHQNLGIPEYAIEEEEFGVIPMTNHRFKLKEGRIIHMGTAGGNTKASTGYTFSFIQKFTQQLTDRIHDEKMLSVNETGARYRFYDSVMLNVLSTGKAEGKNLFTAMFKRNSASSILHFLNNDGHLFNDVRIISSLPVTPFFKAAIEQIF